MHRHITPPMVWRMAAALALLAGIGGAAAMPAAGVPAAGVPTSGVPTPSGPADAQIERVANGCGPGYFRTLAGQCFPNREFVGPYGGIHAPPPCPPGYLRAPDRPLCYPVRR